MNEVEISKHCLERYHERFQGEVKTGMVNVPERIKRDVDRGRFWHSPEQDSFLIVCNQLKTYVAVKEDTGLKILTVYPYTKKVKYKLKNAVKVQSPMAS